MWMLRKFGLTIQQVKEWRTREAELGRAYDLDDFFRAYGICASCRGDGRTVVGVQWHDANGIERTERGSVAYSVQLHGLNGDTGWNYLYEKCDVCHGSALKWYGWPDDFGKRFGLFALGEHFNVDAYIAKSSLLPSFVWRQVGNGTTSGIDFLLGDAGSLNVLEQEVSAVKFLNQHRDELIALAEFPGVEALNLSLIYPANISVAGFSLGPSNALMAAALNARVSPRYYVCIDNPE